MTEKIKSVPKQEETISEKESNPGPEVDYAEYDAESPHHKASLYEML